jgi:hypothetical protein
LRTADYLYTAELRVAAAPGTASRGPSLGGLSGLAAIAGVGIEVEATPFRLYLDDLTSLDAAAELATEQGLMQKVFEVDFQHGSDGRPALTDRLTATLLSRPSAAIPAIRRPMPSVSRHGYKPMSASSKTSAARSWCCASAIPIPLSPKRASSV